MDRLDDFSGLELWPSSLFYFLAPQASVTPAIVRKGTQLHRDVSFHIQVSSSSSKLSRRLLSDAGAIHLSSSFFLEISDAIGFLEMAQKRSNLGKTTKAYNQSVSCGNIQVGKSCLRSLK